MRPTSLINSTTRYRRATPDLVPYEPNVEANQKEHEVDDAPQSQQFWRNGKPKKRNGQVRNIKIRVYPRANKKRTGEKFTDLFPINTHNPTFPNELWNGVNDIRRKHFPHVSYGSRHSDRATATSGLPRQADILSAPSACIKVARTRRDTHSYFDLLSTAAPFYMRRDQFQRAVSPRR
jgi:hypothetical protein